MMAPLAPPDEPLRATGLRVPSLQLRVPSIDAGDASAVLEYIEDAEKGDANNPLDWLTSAVLHPLCPPEDAVASWVAAWHGDTPRLTDPALVVTVVESPRLVGAVSFGCRGDGVEMSYGIAPAWEGRGYATCAVQLAAHWLLDARSVRKVMLEICPTNCRSKHVAENAGFHLAPPGMGGKLRYVLTEAR